ncbi:ABC transporter [[Clostridium] sordellii]|uniref:ABC transporter ATP-binding protein n=1 Tax=Paraclostridium sordellii TaxID=1505 RepID=UPI0005DE5F2C|nr:ATP-binding cassette domain-containing protein [Paeniclostridium sordellii]CEP43294.1 ABC transporter [[Clostridium] sordellii] [Paeniclostridium sordellii]
MTLSVENLSKNYGGHNAVNNMSFNIEEGEILGLVGHNGAGKTTTFRMILGLIEKSNGSIIWNNKDITYLNKDLIGYLPEERGLNDKMTVEDQIRFFAKLHGLNNKEINAKMDDYLDEFGLKDKKKNKAGTLSKGNQQKLQLLISIIHQPKLLILDEPFSGLDPINSDLLKKVVLNVKKKGTTIIFSSHQMENIEELCEKICLVKSGVCLFSGKIDDLKKEYGKSIIYLKSSKCLEDLKNIELIEDIEELKNEYKIKIKKESDAKGIFEYLYKDEFIEKFSLEYPSLHDIFKDKMGEKI